MRQKQKRLADAAIKSSKSIWVLTAFLNKKLEGMINDPDYEDVVEKLEEHIDEDSSEGCCVDQRALDMFSALIFACEKVITI